MFDRTLTPTDERRSFYIYVPAVTFRLVGGQPWAERRDELGDKVLRQMETVMPDISSLVLACAVRTPEDLEAVSGLSGGCMYFAE